MLNVTGKKIIEFFLEDEFPKKLTSDLLLAWWPETACTGNHVSKGPSIKDVWKMYKWGMGVLFKQLAVDEIIRKLNTRSNFGSSKQPPPQTY